MITRTHCAVGKVVVLAPVEDQALYLESRDDFCEDCRARLPDALRECIITEDVHARFFLRTSTGETFRFNGADVEGQWVHLCLVQDPTLVHGVDVRISSIVWCAKESNA